MGLHRLYRKVTHGTNRYVWFEVQVKTTYSDIRLAQFFWPRYSVRINPPFHTGIPLLACKHEPLFASFGSKYDSICAQCCELFWCYHRCSPSQNTFVLRNHANCRGLTLFSLHFSQFNWTLIYCNSLQIIDLVLSFPGPQIVLRIFTSSMRIKLEIWIIEPN